MKLINNERGSVTIFVMFLMVGLLGILGLGIDYGIMVYENINLSNALDAAALAAALELPDSEKAQSKAIEFLEKNGVLESSVVISFNENNTEISLESQKIINHHLLGIIGIDSSQIDVETGAGIVTLTQTSKGVRPFGVIDQNFTYGDEITLKVNAGESTAGNFGALKLGNGPGACVFRSNTLYGYNGSLEVGDMIETEPGNMSMIINPLKQLINYNNDTFDDFERESVRVWTVPVISDYDPNGRTEVEIIGFASFFINDIGKQSGKTSITGRFIEYVTSGSGEVSESGYGLYTAKLVK